MSKTNKEKLASVRLQLVILKPRLTDVFRKNVDQCIEWLHQVEDVLTARDLTGDQKELVDSLSNEEVKSLAALCLRDLVDSDAIEVIEEFANTDSAIAAELLSSMEG